MKKKNGELCGAFEIVQEDLNDRKEIMEKIKAFLKKVEEIAGFITPKITVVSELISTLNGIYKDINNIVSGSYFLRLSNLLVIISLLY